MKHTINILAILVALALVTGAAYAETNYYVDGNLGTDDGSHGHGPGTDAWKTLSYAAANYTAVPNETEIINVAAATYNEIVGSGEGEAGYPLIWRGEAGVVLDATDQGGIAFTVNNYMEIVSFEIKGANGGSHAGSGIRGDGKYQVTITNCCIHNNTEHGIRNYSSCKNWTIVDSVFYSNAAYGIYLEVGGTNNLVEGNKFYGQGFSGLLLLTLNNGLDDIITVRNNVIYDNDGASSYGIYACAAYQDADDNDTLRIYNNTVYGNTKGVWLKPTANGIEFVNNITAGSTGTGVTADNAITITYCDVSDGTNANVTLGTGCITDVPQFMDAAAHDFRLKCPAFGYDNSPCVNAGDPATTTDQAGTVDYLGKKRFVRIIDIGACEAPPPPGTVFSFH